MPSFAQFDDVIYIAGVTFQSEFGTHEAGTQVEEAAQFNNLQVLIDSNFIYPVAPDEGYGYLPSHLFRHINVKEEVMAKLKGAMNPNPDHFQDGKKPESMLQAEREADYKQTEITGSTKLARETAQKAREDAARQHRDLETVDSNPAVQDKSADVKKMQKGDKPAWEILEDQAKKTQERLDKEPKVDKPNTKETKTREVKDTENVDKAASKKPEDKTKGAVDPVGRQPSNVAPGGSKPASQKKEN